MIKSFKIISLVLCVFFFLPHLRANASVHVPVNPTAPLVRPLSDIAEITMGRSHSCALTTQGGIKCWGNNNSGQLGDGTITQSYTPVDVVGMSTGVTALAIGSAFSCALLIDGSVKCWGDNFFGSLGDGTVENRLTPTNVVGLPESVVAISAYHKTTCALLVSGSVMCWGMNSSGLLGEGTNENQRSIPIVVTGLESGVTKLKVAFGHGCVVLTSGNMQCWGNNVYGQLGDGTTNGSKKPVAVSSLTGTVDDISVGNQHTCAVVSGAAKCWGYNWDGQVGDGTNFNWKTFPTDVSGLNGGVAAISAGSDHSCALLTTGGIKCWGNGSNGALGNGNTQSSTTPVDVSGIASGATGISTGMLSGCAVTVTNRVKCWGDTQGFYTGQTNSNISIPAEIIVVVKELTVNYTTGRPGSFFTLKLSGYQSSDSVTMSVNGQPLGVGGISGVSNGIFILATNGADPGGYFVTIDQFSVLIVLSNESPLRPEESGAINLYLPANSAVEIHSVFLPLTSYSTGT